MANVLEVIKTKVQTEAVLAATAVMERQNGVAPNFELPRNRQTLLALSSLFVLGACVLAACTPQDLANMIDCTLSRAGSWVSDPLNPPKSCVDLCKAGYTEYCNLPKK